MEYLSETRPANLPEHLIWEVPKTEVYEFSEKQNKYCFITVIFNEGERIKKQLPEMAKHSEQVDLIIADGRSTDGSTDHDFLKQNNVRALLVTDERGLCTATRMAIAYALEQGYEGIVTVDGNGKDDVSALPRFIDLLEQSYDLIQGSRFLKGGEHRNTPLERYLGVRFVMSPCISLGSGYWYTDVTNAFRACSAKYLLDPRVQPLRKIFVRFNLQLYLDYRAAKLKLKVTEIPVKRVYPDDGTIPTKIVKFRTKLLNVWEMILTSIGYYNFK